MSLETAVVAQMKEAMKSKNKVALETLRAIKSQILLAKTESGAKESLSEEEEIKLVQRLLKQRKESASIYKEQGREDLAADELEQAAVLEQFLPKQLSDDELEQELKEIMNSVGASGMQDMGKVMGVASKQLLVKPMEKEFQLKCVKCLPRNNFQI